MNMSRFYPWKTQILQISTSANSRYNPLHPRRYPLPFRTILQKLHYFCDIYCPPAPFYHIPTHQHHHFSSCSPSSVPNSFKPLLFNLYHSGRHSDTTSHSLQPKATYIRLWEVGTTLDQCPLSFFAFSLFSAHLWLSSIPLCSSRSVACSLPSESHPDLRFYLLCIFPSILACRIAF